MRDAHDVIADLLAQAMAEVELGSKHFKRAEELKEQARVALEKVRATAGAPAND